jgi:hypothetical protein
MVENRGGKREGAGRPKAVRNYSDSLKRDVAGWIKKQIKATGKSFGEVITDIAWGEDTAAAFRIAACKLIADILCVKESKKEIALKDERIRPTIYLPETMPKPAEALEREKELGSVH